MAKGWEALGSELRSPTGGQPGCCSPKSAVMLESGHIAAARVGAAAL